MSLSRSMKRGGLSSISGGRALSAETKLLLGKDNVATEKRDEERERVRAAFIAETGCLPSEIEQVTVHGQNPTREIK